MNKMIKEKTNESGRSMVEMLGVLAVMGVLSVGGVTMYTSAMNKHRANELMYEASKRAVVVAMQLASGKTAPETANSSLISEFTDPAGYTFGVAKKNDNQFNITINAVDSDVCRQMKASVGTASQIRKINEGCTELTFNNDLSTTIFASDFTTQADCKAPFSWCEELGKCQNAGDSCACPDENSSTSGTGDAITGTNCKCNSGYQLNATGTGCESALPYCATEGNCILYNDKGYTYEQAVQKCAENGKTLVMAADLGCELSNDYGGFCPNIPEEFKLSGIRLGDSSIPGAGELGEHFGLAYGDAQDFYGISDDSKFPILCK